MKNFFKRLIAKATKPKTPAKQIPRTQNNTRRIIVAGLVVLLLALAAIYYLFQSEITSLYSNTMQYFGGSTQIAPHHATPHHPVSAVSTSHVVASAISSISSSSSVSSSSGVAVTVSAVSAATSFSPASAVDTEEPMPDAHRVEASTPSTTQRTTRPHNRDFRHCLNLKTDEEIAHCAYPK